MSAPFNVEYNGTVVWSVDPGGNMTGSGTLTFPVSNSPVQVGVVAVQAGGGESTNLSANYLATGAAFALGTGGTQLSDTSRDYMYYLQCTTTGGATVVLGTAQGNVVGSATIFVGSITATNMISFRVPAGWFTRVTGTTAAFGNQYAISC